VNFIAVSGTEFTSKFYGESEANLRRIFAEARQQAPALLFFDELEAFLPRRSDLSRADAPERGLVATFLAQTDGIADLDGVLLVGATNHPELIDPAALRPGRFDKLIYLSPPGLQARRQILELYLRGQPLAASLDLEQLAARLERFTGADIQALCAAALRSAWGRSQASALQPPAAGSRRGWRWTSAGGSASRQTRPAPPPLEPQDFEKALGGLKPSVTFSMLRAYEALADQYGRRSARPEPVEVVAKPALGWEAVAGLEPVVQALRQAIELPLAHPELLKEYGVKACKGVLLFGPPGCGKTFLAKAAAGAARAHFLSVKGPELLRQAIGQSESLLRELFARARENAPCVLFFDEIDALAEARGSPGAGSTQLLTQLLTELDGFEELRGVMVLAATNRPAALDPALLRPGRFDRLLCVPPPDRPARLALLQKELRGKPLADDVDLPALADLAGQAGAGAYSAADLVALVNAAALEALNAALAETPHERHPVMPITQAILLEQLRLLPPSISAEQLAECESWRARLQR
jgi:transitional endoplasmic reticulum ATPase